jgi:hypothetical protein
MKIEHTPDHKVRVVLTCDVCGATFAGTGNNSGEAYRRAKARLASHIKSKRKGSRRAAAALLLALVLLSGCVRPGGGDDAAQATQQEMFRLTDLARPVDHAATETGFYREWQQIVGTPTPPPLWDTPTPGVQASR